LDYFPSLSPPWEIGCCSSFDDHEDDYFVSIVNKEDTISSLIQGFPFKRLRDYTAASHSNDTNQVEQQAAKVSRVFTSSMLIAQQEDNGVPIPYLRQGSWDAVVVTSHEKATSILQEVSLPWLGRSFFNPNPSRIRGFTDQVSTRSIIKGSTFTLGSSCAWHRDVHNPLPPQGDFTWVMNINHSFEGGGIFTALFYQRSSGVCSHLRPSAQSDPLLQHFQALYLRFPEDSWTLSHC
jgi:hypothetical protein